MAGPRVVLAHHQHRPTGRRSFLGFEHPALEGLGQLGGDHLEDVAAQHRQRLRVVLARETDEMGLGGGALLSGDRELPTRRQPVQRRHDHPGLRGVHLTVPERLGQHGIALQGFGELQVRPRGDLGLTGRDRSPVRRRGRSGDVTDPGAFGLGQHPQPQRLELSLGPGKIDQGRTLLLGPHRPRRHRSQLAEPGTHGAGELRDRVRPGLQLAAHENHASRDHRQDRTGVLYHPVSSEQRRPRASPRRPRARGRGAPAPGRHAWACRRRPGRSRASPPLPAVRSRSWRRRSPW